MLIIFLEWEGQSIIWPEDDLARVHVHSLPTNSWVKFCFIPAFCSQSNVQLWKGFWNHLHVCLSGKTWWNIPGSVKICTCVTQLGLVVLALDWHNSHSCFPAGSSCLLSWPACFLWGPAQHGAHLDNYLYYNTNVCRQLGSEILTAINYF